VTDDAAAALGGTFDLDGETTVHRLGFGTTQLCGPDVLGPPADEADAKRVLRRVVELGVDFVDTADSYGPGVAERLVGETLASPGPGDDAGTNTSAAEDVVVATKTGLLRNRRGDWLKRGDPDFLRNQVLCSLDRLRTGTIDLYQLHRPDPDTPFADTVTTLAELRDDGFVRHVGLSNVTVDQLDEAREIVDVATVQNSYNVADREHEDVLRACEDAGIGFVPYYPLAAGSVDGAAARVLDEVADAHGATRLQVALAWLLHRSPVTLPIPGTSSVAHAEENVAAASLALDDDELARLEEVDG